MSSAVDIAWIEFNTGQLLTAWTLALPSLDGNISLRAALTAQTIDSTN
jgi:hypothetical protein